ncbi:phage tail tape measure protein [Streptomyces pseudogriseolus]
MALTVGELLAVVDVDTSAMRSGLADAERDARRSGENIGEGVADGAAAAGGDAADAAGSSIAGRLGDSLKAGLAGAGIAAGALLAAGFGQALEQGQITGRLGAQLGATPAEAEKYGKIAGRLYSNAVTEDFQTAADTISAVMRAGIAPPDATEAQLESIATKVADLAGTFELDLGQTANAVGQMLKTGLAKNGTEAVDILTAGLQKMGPRADDIADTFNEYSVIFQRLGVDATTATGLMSQGLKAGARDTDVVADALKEFTIEGVQGSEKIVSGFENIGLNAQEMTKKIAKGGPDATEALQMTLDALRDMEDPIKRDAAATELFGTKSEDMQKALLALDPSKATAALGQVGGKAKEMGDSLRDNAGAQVEKFKRQAMQGLVDFLGTSVIPKLTEFAGFLVEHKEELKLFAAVITAAVVPALTLLGGRALWAGAQMAAAWVAALGPIGWIGLAIGALVVLVIAYWDEIKKYTLIAWNWVVDKLIWAKDKVLAAVDYLGEIPGKVSKWFGQAKDWAVEKMLALVSWAQGLPGRITGAISSLGSRLRSDIGRYFQGMRDSAVQRALALVSWVRGLPGRISAGIGSLSSLLTGKGRNVVQGLWSGIRSMGGWLKDKIIGWARDVIPGPVAKALGIASPSRVMRDKIGRWIPAGIVEGIEGGSGAVARAMSTLVRPPAVPQLTPQMAGAYGGDAFAAARSNGATVHVEHWHAAENGSPEDNAAALAWLAKARG